MRDWEQLNATIVGCEKCPRLVAYRQQVAQRKKLMQALYAVGLASQPFSVRRDDGLNLSGVYLTAVCRCAPPDNRPLPEELRRCLPYLVRGLELLPQVKVLVALGQIAFQWTLRALQALAYRYAPVWRLPSPRPKFSHGAHYPLPDLRGGTLHLLASYHPSRQNTQTGRLTVAMLTAVLARAKRLAGL